MAIDKLIVTTNINIKPQFMSMVYEKGTKFQTVQWKDGYKLHIFYDKRRDYNGEELISFSIFVDNSRKGKNQRKHKLIINPTHFLSRKALINFLKQVFEFDGDQLSEFFIQQIDFAVDIELFIDEAVRQIGRSKISNYQTIISQRGKISQVILGKSPLRVVLYDKRREMAEKGPKGRYWNYKKYPKGLTRLEVRMENKGNSKLPISTLSEFGILVNYDPFSQYFKFFEKSIIPRPDLKPSEKRKADYLDYIINDIEKGGMQRAPRYAREELRIAKKDFHKFFIEVDRSDLFQLHQNQLKDFMSSKNYKPQKLGGIKL